MKPFNLILPVTILALLLSSCSSNPTLEVEDTCEISSAQLDTIYKYAGVIHNIQLDSVIDWLLASPHATTEEITLVELNEAVANQLEKYTYNVDFTDYDNIADTMYCNDEFLEYSFGDIASLYGFTISNDFEDAADELIYFMKNLPDDDDLSQEFAEIYEDWIDEISDCDEKVAFAGMVSVGMHSLEYWEIRSEILGGSILPRSSRFKDVALADALGAGTGALTGAVIGLTGGTMVIPGIGTGIGGASGVMVGMIYGCIGGSGRAAGFEIFKWAIGW